MSNSLPIHKILVHGANGVQGGAIARSLRREGFEVRACVRDVARAGSLAADCVDVVAADLGSTPALRAASHGVDAVVLTLPLSWDRETVLRWTRNASTAARDGGAGLIVLNNSTRIPSRPTEVQSFELRREAEAVLREAGLPSIVLRPPLFMENLANPLLASAMVTDRALPYPLQLRVRVPWLAAADLGAYVGAALRRPDLAGRALDVGGPEMLDGQALTDELSPAVGHALRYVPVPPGDFERGLAAHFGPAVARGIAQTYFWMAENSDADLFRAADSDLARDLSRPLVAIAEWARSQSWAPGVARIGQPARR